MPDPIVFVTAFHIHEGKLKEFKEAAKKSLAFNEANGPHLMAGIYIDEKAMRAHGLQIHRDSESILAAWQLADPHIRSVMPYLTTTRVEIYGQPNEAVMEGMQRLSGEGAELIVTPRLAGFSRFPTNK